MERVISQAEDSVIHHTQVDGGEDSRGKADSRSGPVFTKHFILPLRNSKQLLLRKSNNSLAKRKTPMLRLTLGLIHELNFNNLVDWLMGDRTVPVSRHMLYDDKLQMK